MPQFFGASVKGCWRMLL